MEDAKEGLDCMPLVGEVGAASVYDGAPVSGGFAKLYAGPRRCRHPTTRAHRSCHPRNI